MKYTKTEQAEALAHLRTVLRPGDNVWCVLRHVARSGMSRHLDLYVPCLDAETKQVTEMWLSGWTAKVLGLRQHGKSGALVVGGCGMDMGFHVVSSLARVMHPKGFGCIGERCPSNDHSNGDRDYTPHPGCGKPDRRGHRDHWHNNGDYAFRHRWL
jgi:hypothetical protein